MAILEFGNGYNNNGKTPCVENLLLCVVAEMRRRIYPKKAVHSGLPGGGSMEIILLAVSASMFEGSDSSVAVFDPECEHIMTSCNVGHCLYEKHLGRVEFSLERLTLNVQTLRRFETSGKAHALNSMTSQNT